MCERERERGERERGRGSVCEIERGRERERERENIHFSSKVRPDSPDYKVFFNYEFLEDFRDEESVARRFARRFTLK